MGLNVITAAVLSALRVGFNKSFYDGLALAPSNWQKVAVEIKSTTAVNMYGWMSSLPKMREWIGDRVLNVLKTNGYSLTNRKFEESIGVARTDIEDDNVGMYGMTFTELGRVSKEHIDESVFGLLATNGDCFDGQPYFDTDHPIYGIVGEVETVLGTYSNCDIDPSTPDAPRWYLLDTSRAIKPFIYQNRLDAKLTSMDSEQDEATFMRDEFRYGVRARRAFGYTLPQLAFVSNKPLTADSYADAKAKMEMQVTDNNRKLGIKATLLVVPPNLDKTAKLIIKADTINGTTNVNRDDVELLSTSFVVADAAAVSAKPQ